MRRRLAFALLLALAPWASVHACTCLRPVLPELYKDSARVLLGEVVKAELQTDNPVHGQEVTWVATVRPVETYKGRPDADVRVTYRGQYAEPGRTLSPETTVDESGRTLTLITSSCSFGMELGAKYYIFEKQDEQLHYSGWCSQRVMYESIIIREYMRKLRDANQPAPSPD